MQLLDNLPVSLQLVLRLVLLIEVIALSYLSGRLFAGWVLGFKLREIKLGFGQRYLCKLCKYGWNFSLTIFPLGGVVQFADQSTSDTDIDASSAYSFKKICLLLSGPIGNLAASIIILAISFAWFGDSNYTMQVVNILKNSPAEKVEIIRGDIVLSVNGEKITKFEKGRQLISAHPDRPIILGIERKSDYLQFSDYKGLLDYLKKLYRPTDYIRIFDSDEQSRIFYAKEPALSYLEKVNLNNLRVEISTSSKFFDLRITPDLSGQIGIGIKPYSLPNSVTYPGPIKSLSLALSYISLIMAALIDEIKNFITNLLAQGSFYLEIHLISEMFQFIIDFSNFNVSIALKYLSMLCMSAGILNLLPFPSSVGYYVLAMVGRKFINNICQLVFGLDGNLINEDIENYLRLLYRGAFGLVLLLIMAHSFPALSRLF